MVGSQYQAEVPTCLSHYKEGEKGAYFTSTLCMQLPGVKTKEACSGLGDNISALLVCMQLTKMKTSYYGARVRCQKAKSEVSCRKCRRERPTKRTDAINPGLTCVTTSG